MQIFCTFPTVSQYLDFFLHSQIPYFHIFRDSVFLFFFYNSCFSAKYKTYINGTLFQLSDLFSFQMMYKAQFKKKIDPYDWFCGLGSHIISYNIIWYNLFLNIYIVFLKYNTMLCIHGFLTKLISVKGYFKSFLYTSCEFLPTVCRAFPITNKVQLDSGRCQYKLSRLWNSYCHDPRPDLAKHL